MTFSKNDCSSYVDEFVRIDCNRIVDQLKEENALLRNELKNYTNKRTNYVSSPNKARDNKPELSSLCALKQIKEQLECKLFFLHNQNICLNKLQTKWHQERFLLLKQLKFYVNSLEQYRAFQLSTVAQMERYKSLYEQQLSKTVACFKYLQQMRDKYEEKIYLHQTFIRLMDEKFQRIAECKDNRNESKFYNTPEHWGIKEKIEYLELKFINEKRDKILNRLQFENEQLRKLVERNFYYFCEHNVRKRRKMVESHCEDYVARTYEKRIKFEDKIPRNHNFNSASQKFENIIQENDLSENENFSEYSDDSFIEQEVETLDRVNQNRKLPTCKSEKINQRETHYESEKESSKKFEHIESKKMNGIMTEEISMLNSVRKQFNDNEIKIRKYSLEKTEKDDDTGNIVHMDKENWNNVQNNENLETRHKENTKPQNERNSLTQVKEIIKSQNEKNSQTQFEENTETQYEGNTQIAENTKTQHEKKIEIQDIENIKSECDATYEMHGNQIHNTSKTNHIDVYKTDETNFKLPSVSLIDKFVRNYTTKLKNGNKEKNETKNKNPTNVRDSTNEFFSTKTYSLETEIRAKMKKEETDDSNKICPRHENKTEELEKYKDEKDTTRVDEKYIMIDKLKENEQATRDGMAARNEVRNESMKETEGENPRKEQKKCHIIDKKKKD